MLHLHDVFNFISFHHADKGATVDTPLCKAVRQGSLREVKRLLKDGADPNECNSNHISPLHQAAYWGETEIARLLLKHGADPNLDNGKGWTPLHSAALSGGMKARGDIIEMLLEAGANLEKQDKLGWTPQDYMKLWEENAEAAQKLKEHHDMLEGKPQLHIPFWRPHKTYVPAH